MVLSTQSDFVPSHRFASKYLTSPYEFIDDLSAVRLL